MKRIPWPIAVLPPSPGDKLIAGAYGAKIELMRFTDDETGESEANCEFQITGRLATQADARELLSALLGEFTTPATDTPKGDDAHEV